MLFNFYFVYFFRLFHFCCELFTLYQLFNLFCIFFSLVLIFKKALIFIFVIFLPIQTYFLFTCTFIYYFITHPEYTCMYVVCIRKIQFPVFPIFSNKWHFFRQKLSRSVTWAIVTYFAHIFS